MENPQSNLISCSTPKDNSAPSETPVSPLSTGSDQLRIISPPPQFEDTHTGTEPDQDISTYETDEDTTTHPLSTIPLKYRKSLSASQIILDLRILRNNYYFKGQEYYFVKLSNAFYPIRETLLKLRLSRRSPRYYSNMQYLRIIGDFIYNYVHKYRNRDNFQIKCQDCWRYVAIMTKRNYKALHLTPQMGEQDEQPEPSNLSQQSEAAALPLYPNPGYIPCHFPIHDPVPYPIASMSASQIFPSYLTQPPTYHQIANPTTYYLPAHYEQIPY